MPYYQPVLLAKQLATLDLVSGGRLDVGLGVGWSEDEYDAVGVPFTGRGRRADEFLRCLKAVWTQEVVEFSGSFYRIPRSRIEPKPVQKPHPPLTLGGYSPAVMRRVVTLADGFSGGNLPLAEVRRLIDALGEAAATTGRDVRGFQIVCRGVFRVHRAPQGDARRPLWGTLEEIREDIQRYAAAGLTELFLEANFDPAGPDVDSVLDVMAALAPGT
jgi:probable F420-dependent oxidoreductase